MTNLDRHASTASSTEVTSGRELAQETTTSGSRGRRGGPTGPSTPHQCPTRGQPPGRSGLSTPGQSRHSRNSSIDPDWIEERGTRVRCRYRPSQSGSIVQPGSRATGRLGPNRPGRERIDRSPKQVSATIGARAMNEAKLSGTAGQSTLAGAEPRIAVLVGGGDPAEWEVVGLEPAYRRDQIPLVPRPGHRAVHDEHLLAVLEEQREPFRRVTHLRFRPHAKVIGHDHPDGVWGDRDRVRIGFRRLQDDDGRRRLALARRRCDRRGKRDCDGVGTGVGLSTEESACRSGSARAATSDSS